MPLKIKKVIQGSCAHKKGLKADDTIVAINGSEINDFIDLKFYTVDDALVFEILDASGKIKKLNFSDCWDGMLGIEPEAYKIKKCSNNCIFCFIDQMPPKMRSNLYVKDDDYLYSFTFGNYISLNNLDESELNRIVRQRISPLYISVHSTDEKLRAKIMGYQHPFSIIDRLKFLSGKGISFHTQIVLMPGINDQQNMLKTVNDLLQPELNTLSVGIVPVGLTKFRQGLKNLKPYTPESADRVIKQILPFPESEKPVYLADEFFILAGTEVPPSDYYADFCQLENGIGMVRTAISNFSANKDRLISQLEGKTTLFITAKLAEKMIKQFSKEINKTPGSGKNSVLRVDNHFFGDSVSVTGLLTYSDIKREIQSLSSLPDTIVLSSNTFNNEGYTIDGYCCKDLKKSFGREILIVNELWDDWSYA